MLTIELKPELENALKKMAEKEHISVGEIINRLLTSSFGETHLSDEQKIIKLNEQQQQNFIDSLLNPKASNEKLKQSALLYKEKMGL